MDKTSDLTTMPGHLIRRAHQISSAIFMEECAEQNLTPIQFACLQQLSGQSGLDATRVAAAIAVDRSTLGDVLERMEGRDWIARRPSPEDRRIKLLYITAKGEALLDAVAPAVEATQRRLLAPLAASDRDVFIRLLAQLVEGNNELSRAPLDAKART